MKPIGRPDNGQILLRVMSTCCKELVATIERIEDESDLSLWIWTREPLAADIERKNEISKVRQVTTAVAVIVDRDQLAFQGRLRCRCGRHLVDPPKLGASVSKAELKDTTLTIHAAPVAST